MLMDKRKRLERVIARIESQRGVLGDEVIEASIAALRKELTALQPAEEQRKQVTVLFADLVGFTSMAESLDPEELREIQQAYFNTVTQPIEDYGGSVEKYIGDAILAVFGVPSAHEDDPERAVRAAMGMLKALNELNGQLEAERGWKLSIRIGVNTGLVVSQVDQEDDFVVTGDAVNLASRLESAAEPGTVLMSAETHQLASHAFETKALDPIQVKGKTELVRVYQVLDVKALAIKPRGIRGLDSPLVGREVEFAALQGAVERLQAGKGGIVTVIGEAGIGKSRLVSEMRKDVLERDLTWVEGRCLSYGGSIAYLPWLEVFRGLIGVGAEEKTDVARNQLWEWIIALCPEHTDEVYPYLGKLLLLPLEVEVQEYLETLEGKELRDATFMAVESIISCAARERPLVIVCEDLHWADPSTLALLEYLFPLVAEVPLLFMCVFRIQQEHGSRGLREIIAGDYTTWHTDLLLQPLPAGDSEQLVGNLLGLEDLPEKLVERILEQAEGNPFYVEEVIRSLIDTGAIQRSERTGRWRTTRAVDTIPIPETLHGVLMARIDRLEGDTKKVLQLASVIGRIFLYRVLAAITEDEHSLDEKLLFLQWEELIRERTRLPEYEFIFKHALTQEAAYHGILKKHRRTFHRQVGEALERLFPERLIEMLGSLAYHWERSGEAEKAVSYLQKAGDQARLLYAHAEAIDFYQRAMAIQKDNEDFEGAARTMMKLGLVHHTAFDYKSSRESYDKAFAMWRKVGEKSQATLMTSAPHALRLAVNYAPRSLDPSLASDVASASVIKNLFSGLLKFTPENDILPDLAQSWEVLEQGRKYIFHLREDAQWNDKVPVTADDFIFAWKRVLDPDTQSFNAELLYDIKGARAFNEKVTSNPDSLGIQAPDPYTLVVELEEPCGHFLLLLAITAAYPVPRHVLRVYGEKWTKKRHIVTNGPFQLESLTPGQSMHLIRNPIYYGNFIGNVKRVQINLIESISASSSHLLDSYGKDLLDILEVSWFPPEDYQHVRRKFSGDLISFPKLSTASWWFNTTKPPFNDVLVRRAFTLALDRDSGSYQGRIFPATGGFVPPGMPGHSPGIGLPYDPGKARQLLAQAGYPDGRNFPVIESILMPNSESFFEQDRLVWRENLGVELSYEAGSFGDLDNISRAEQFHLTGLAWDADYPDPDNFLRVGFPWEFTRWKNEPYQRLLRDARKKTDQTERMKLYKKADKILVQEAPIIPGFYGRTELLIKPWIRGVLLSTSGLDWKDIIVEPH